MSQVFCPSCGEEVNTAAVFCHKCGHRVDGQEEAKSSGSPRDKFQSSARGTQEDDESEEELWEGGYSAKAMYGTWLLAFLLTVVAIVIAVLTGGLAMPIAAVLVAVMWVGLALLLAVRKIGMRYKLTSQRFVHRAGILKQITDRIEVIDMDDVTFEQGIIQRMLGVGTITISSSDKSHPQLQMKGIDDVQTVATLIDDIRRKERRRRGLHIEAI